MKKDHDKNIITIDNDLFAVLFDIDEINMSIQDSFNDVIEWLGDHNINEDSVIFISLANGGNYMLHELLNNTKYNIDYIIAKSYNGEEKGELNVIYCPIDKIHDKTIIVVDDIIDTGDTIEKVCNMLKEYGAKTVEKCVLCKREGNPISTINNPIIIPKDLWIVGCGMDHNGYGRMLNKIYYKI